MKLLLKSRAVALRAIVSVASLGVIASSFGQNAPQIYAPQSFAPQGTQFATVQDIPTVVLRSLPTGHTYGGTVLHVAVSLPPVNEAAFENFAESVSDPKSPNYRHFLTPEQVGAQFGPSQATVDRVTNYLQSQGFYIKLVAKDHLAILADCTAAQAEAAFKTTINNYHCLDANPAGNADFYAPATPLRLPALIAPSVANISGVETFTKPQPRALTPSQTKVLYNLAPLASTYRGEGRTVAISSFDGFLLSNVPLYYAQYKLPIPPGGVGSNITWIPIDGGSGSGPAQGEADLDIQMVLGMAPLCNFRIYDGGLNLIDVLTQEGNDNLADVISESYGWLLDVSTAVACHNAHLAMTAQGITYMTATGDSGTQLEPFAYSNYEPEVLLVGGTVATVDTTGKRISEVGWSGGGGGWATEAVPFNVHPTWQVGPGIPGVPYRLSPDVAIHASSNSGAYYFFFAGKLTNGFVGTSFASPVFAGSLAVAEQKMIANGALSPDQNGKRRMGRIQNLIYSQRGRPDIWYDVTQGSNGVLPNGQTSVAGPGWDFVTGWGAPDFTAFANSVLPVLPPITVDPSTVSTFNGWGSGPSGGIGGLYSVDQSYYTLNSVSDPLGQVAANKLTFTIPGSPTKVVSTKINFVVRAPLRTTNQIFAWNYAKSTWDLLLNTPMTGADKAITYALSVPATYISAGGQVQLVQRTIYPARMVPTPYTLYLDLGTLTVQQTA